MMFSKETKSTSNLNKNYDAASSIHGDNESTNELDEAEEESSLVQARPSSNYSTYAPDFSSLDDEPTKLRKTKLRIDSTKRKKNKKHLVSLTLLFLLNLLNYTDRYLISSVLIDIEDYYDITKSESGLLHSLFLISFTLAAPFVGYAGDRYKRKSLLLISCSLWLASTVSGSFVSSSLFGLFLATRCLFGAASAFYECISMPIISDLFRVEPDNPKSVSTRTRALFLFYLGPPIGTGLSFLIGNTIRDLFPSDWRYAMQLTPILLFALLVGVVFLFEEPERTKAVYSALSESRPHSFVHNLKELASNQTYILLVASASCGIASIVGFNWWAPTYISYLLKSQLKSDEQEFEIKQIYSVFQSVVGAVGTLLPSELSNLIRRLRPGLKEVDCFLLSFSLIASSVSLYVYLIASSLNSYLDIVFYSLYQLFINFWRILLANIVLEIVDPKLRATANSILLVLLHVIGDASAPFWIGLINESCINKFTFKNSISNMTFCTKTSLYPLVIILAIGASASLFSTLTFYKNKLL
jgi:MFS family permease